jgi:diguanylate cyclase (GGDEF)-like protein
VDDESSNITVLRKILNGNYTISIAKTGSDAIQRALEHKPDLILLDVMLPDLSGFDVLQRLKAMDEARDIPVIFITGVSSVEDEEKGLLMGAVDYITKPFVHSIVRARIKTQLQLVKHMRTIERLGMIDPLTEIPNRRFFDIRLNDEWRRTWRHKSWLSVLMLDVDLFKQYNDTYGHPQGDILLRFIAKTLIANLKRPSDIAARIGGDEFTILLSDTNLKGAQAVAEHIRLDVADGRILCRDTGELSSITISIGINTLIPAMDIRTSDFIEQADKNLYNAKAAGRNKIIG